MSGHEWRDLEADALEDFGADIDDLDDLGSPQIERFEDRAHRISGRKPARRRSVKALLAENQEHYDPLDNTKFADPGLEDLFERTLITDVLWELKSGKEATVYVCSSDHALNGLAAAKLYIDSRVRSFKDDSLYRQGRFLDDKRLQKAIDHGSRTGMDARNYLWVSEEFGQLSALHAAGVPTPKPLARSEVGGIILMEFIGSDNEAAPRVADAKLTRAEAEDAFAQAVQAYGLILSTGRVHGDYSTFNLLWWQGRVIVIDFPQVVMINDNPAAREILERDIVGLCRTFAHFGIKRDPASVLSDAQRIARSASKRTLTEQQEAVL